ncbi:MAG: hypothetical protein HY876_08430 [Coriobacteriales bacterium]|nr:hypothetical protein [Coriobacteriales bacterium]
MKRFGLVIAALLCIAMAAGLVGCQQIAEQAAESAAEKATGTKIDKEGDSITIEGKEGEKATIGQGELPADFPTDAPVYPGAKVVASYEQGTGAAKSYVVTFETADPASKVNDWYVTEIEAKGWTIDTKANQGENYILNATKGTQRLALTIAADQGQAKTLINETVTPE